MFVYLQFCGRRGNQMFQYWVGRYIADVLDWPLHVYSGDYGQVFLSNRDYPDLRLDSIQKIEVPKDAWEQSVRDTNDLNIEQTIASHRASKRPIYICKQLENYHMMYPYINYVRALYHRDLEKVDRIAVHMRLGDLAHINGPLNTAYIAFVCNVVQKHPKKPVLIVSEDCDSPWTRDMQRAIHNICRCDVTIQRTNNASYQTDSDCLTSSSIIVATNSTFAWWAAMLSEHATEVHMFLDKNQFCSDLRTKFIYPKDILPKHWHIGGMI